MSVDTNTMDAAADTQNTEQLMTELSQLGVRLGLRDDGQISVNAPKGSLTQEMLGRIKSHKVQLTVALSSRSNTIPDMVLPLIVPDPASLHQAFGLGDIQTSFLMGDNPSMEYHVRPHYYLEVEFLNFDVSRFEDALNTVLYRQRNNLYVVNKDLNLQAIDQFTPIKLDLHDTRGLSIDEEQEKLSEIRNKISRQTLPLDKWPWVNCGVVLYSGSRARFYWNNNNFFSDGYGTHKLLEDARKIYQGSSLKLSDLSLNYRDCALALATLEESSLGLASKAYWLERIPFMPESPSLSIKAGVDSRQRSYLERREAIITEQNWISFKNLTKQHGLTPTNALFAVYAEVVATWSGSRHFLFNNMVTHRLPLHPEIKEIIGNFASLYPLEIDWRNEKPFASRAIALQVQITNDMMHTHWSGVKVLQALNQAQKAPGRAPCPFVVGSGLFMEPLSEQYFGCLETPQVLLDHQFWEVKEKGLWVMWDVIESCFPAGMINAMWNAYIGLIQHLADTPQAWQQSSFDLLPPAQRNMRQQINQTHSPIPTGLLQDGLLRSAQTYPNHTAVVAHDRRLSYAQLYGQANQLAHALRSHGTQLDPQTGERIAVILDKGWQQVVAVYGVLHAGAVYVPIDPTWPAARVQYLLKTTGAKQIVSRVGLLGLIRALELPAHMGVLCVDDPALERFPNTALVPLLPLQQPQDLAYIIFTSGSTGMPKGVMISHDAALNTVLDINQRFDIRQHDVIFGISALHFDLSVYDLFGVAAAGATLVLPTPSSAPDPADWLRLAQQHGVTVWNSVPALMQLLVDAAQLSQTLLPSLKTVMLSGDWISPALPQHIWQTCPNTKLFGLGGATEAAIWSIYHPIERGTFDPYDGQCPSVPYGKPLGNQSWHILHEDGRDAPTWVSGNLYIGGRGLALGYWQDQAKTAAAFITHPITGERLYKTGDLGRYLPDGNIEFLGRADFQVKLNGHRVELGEIEQVLLTHPLVHTVSAQVQTTNTGTSNNQQLLVFVVPEAGVDLAGSDLLESPSLSDLLLTFMRGKLPAYMVPSSITPLQRLPLTPNGKLDRNALLELGTRTQTEKPAFAAARTPLEASLVQIWQEVLEIAEISIHDDFFDLGGQSFSAVRVMTRVAQQFGKQLALSTLLEGRTIAYLAQCIESDRAWSPLVPMHLENQARANPCFWVHPAGGNVLCYRNLVENLAQNLARGLGEGLSEGLGRSFYGLQAPGLGGEQPALEDLFQMAQLYVEAIRKVQPRGPYLLGGWSSGGVIAFEMARQLEAAGETVQHLITLDSPAPMQHTPVDDRTLILWFLEDLNIGYRVGTVHLHEFPQTGLEAQFHTALELAGQRQTLRLDMDEHHLLPIFRVFRGIIHATRNYAPSPIRANILALKASQNQVSEFIDHPDADAADWGWSRWTSGTVQSHFAPGNHYSMFYPENLGAMLQVLKEYLVDVKGTE
jgi:amino acid adenylation domain-containing protein